MKVVVLGGGALGSIIAAHLARAGEDVVLLARGQRAAHVREHGITIKSLAEFTVPVTVVDDPRQIQGAGLLIVTVKTYDTELALRDVSQIRAAAVLSVQNGVVKNEQLAAVFGPAATLGATADFSGEVSADGSVMFTRNEGFYVGELPQGTSKRVNDAVSMLGAAGVRAVASDHIQTVEWSKFAGWLSLTPVAVLCRLETHRVLKDPDLAAVQVTLAREAAALAARLGIELDDLIAAAPARTLASLSFEEAVARQNRMGETMEARGVTAHKMSALQDLERGRRLEVEETFGYAVRKAQEVGLAVPVLDTSYRLLRGIDRASSTRS